MRILATGAAGFICSYLIPELLEAGHEVIGVDDLSRYGRTEHAMDRHPRYRFVAADVLDTQVLRDLAEDCDQLVAAAGVVGRTQALSELAYDLLAENERINASTFDAAIDACLDGRLQRIIVVSSALVYESATVFPTPEGAERKSPPPISTYGFQKLAAEYFAHGAWEQYRLPFTIVRPSSPVGRGERRALHRRPARTSRRASSRPTTRFPTSRSASSPARIRSGCPGWARRCATTSRRRTSRAASGWRWSCRRR